MEQESDFIKAVRPLFRRRRLYNILSTFFGLVTIIAYILARIVSGSPGFIIAFLLFFLLFVFVIVPTARASYNIENRVWSRFAEYFDTQLANTYEVPAGILGRLGYSRTINPIVAGIYGGYPVRLFEETVYNNKKDAQYTTRYRVLDITLKQNFYSVFMDAKKLSGISRAVSNNQKLKVEGDVNTFFTIYVPKDTKYNGLITLTPEKLWDIRQYGRKFDIEFANNHIYIISNAKLKNVNDVLVYQESVLDLIKDIGVNVERRRVDATEALEVKEPGWWVRN